jgi:hypothetical protein
MCDIVILEDPSMICKKTMNKSAEGNGKCVGNIVQAPQMVIPGKFYELVHFFYFKIY